MEMIKDFLVVYFKTFIAAICLYLLPNPEWMTYLAGTIGICLHLIYCNSFTQDVTKYWSTFFVVFDNFVTLLCHICSSISPILGIFLSIIWISASLYIMYYYEVSTVINITVPDNNIHNTAAYILNFAIAQYLLKKIPMYGRGILPSIVILPYSLVASYTLYSMGY